MIFPTLALWSTPDPQDPIGRIDRALNDRNHRLIAGLSVSEKFDNVHGALVVSQGNGKHVRVRHVVESVAAIPQSIRKVCLEYTHGHSNDIGQLSQILADLAEVQASVIEKLKCAAGKYVDRVLSVSVCDPGYWQTDFDGRVSYSSMCDATRLAELCGVTVIDAFPARDLCVGGKALAIDALPNWILFADRDPRIAHQTRCLVCVDEQAEVYSLPASDGLDAELPGIQYFSSTGFGFLDEIVNRCFSQNNSSQASNQLERKLDRLYADGLYTEELRNRWDARLEEFASPGSQFNSLNENPSSGLDNFDSTTLKNSTLSPLRQAIVSDAESYLNQRPDGLSSVIRTGVRWVVEQLIQDLEEQHPARNSDSSEVEQLSQILVACPAQYEACLINQFGQLLADSAVLGSVKVIPTRQLEEPKGLSNLELPAVNAALLGLFHIDQMPANIPWITGADSQRILGRLTPGRPTNWRQLVRVMADFQPAPMKLKDAV